MRCDELLSLVIGNNSPTRRLGIATCASDMMVKKAEALEFLANEGRPEGPPLKNANLIYAYFMVHPEDGYEPRWFPERDGQNGFARYLDEQIDKAEEYVLEISEDGDFARSDERMALYRRKIAKGIETVPRKVEDGAEGTVQKKTEGIQMRFMLNFDAGWKDMLYNVHCLQEAGAEVKHFVPGKPYDGSNFGVIDDRLLFCITRQPSQSSTVKKIYGEPQPETAAQTDLSGEPKKMMSYAMIATEHPAFVEVALNKLRNWWGRAEECEAAMARLEAFHQQRAILSCVNGNAKKNGNNSSP